MEKVNPADSPILILALDNSKELQEMRDGLVDKYKNIKKDDKDRLEHFLPSTIGNIELILEIEKIANLNGMPVKDIKFQAPKTISEEDSQNQVIDENDPSQYLPYGIFPMEFIVEGSYDSFLLFLNDLEHNLRLVDIKSVSFEIPDDTKKDLGNPNIYSYTLKIETYWLK